MHPEIITCTCRSAVACRVPHGVWLASEAHGLRMDGARVRAGIDPGDRRPVWARSIGRFGPPFEARYAGTCVARCGFPIRPGQQVRVVSELGIMHHESECRQAENMMREEA